MVHLIPYIKEESGFVVKAGEDYPWGVRMIHASNVWEDANYGEGVVIAVIDTGCNYNHPDLKDRIIGGHNFVQGGNPDDFMDDNSHGTHVAGTICASLNGSGVVGVAPKAKLLVIKVLDGEGSGHDNWVIDGIRYATNWVGKNGERVRVISMSLGSSYSNEVMHEAIKQAVARDIVVVCAAGNEGDGNSSTPEYCYPGAWKEVVCVGAVSIKDSIASFSNSNDEVDLVAPGVQIYSTSYTGGFETLSGTSMATPHVSGAVALLINIMEKQYKRHVYEPEVYAQICKATRPLPVDKRLEGNGALDLSVVSVKPRMKLCVMCRDFIDRITMKKI
jgi:major intracellular serine protease